jgi:glycosyltransferase involved in cell wall biosynthesis
VRSALEAWRFLLTLDPESDEARRGIAWCNATLARVDEQESDFTGARFHWAAVLEVLPDDQAALDGLRRAIESGAATAPVKTREQAARWGALQQHLTKTARPDYRSQCAAGRSLLAAGAPELAVPFLEKALRRRQGSEAALLLCRCQIALGQFDEAAHTLQIIWQKGELSSVSRQDLRILLIRTSPAAIPDELLSAICADFAGGPELVAPLMPLLIGRGFREQVLKLTDDLSDDADDWSDSTVLDTAVYLAGLGEQDRALRFLAVFSGAPAIGAAFLACADRYGVESLETAIFAAGNSLKGLGACVALIEYCIEKGDPNRVEKLLSRLAAAPAESRTFYKRNKDRLTRLMSELLQPPFWSPAVRDGLARLIAPWVSDAAKSLFSSSVFAEACTGLRAVARFRSATAEEKLGLLREQYFEHHMERRNNVEPGTLGSDFGLCEAALQYFSSAAEIRPIELIPVSSELRSRLTTPCLPLGSGRFADLLMSYAMFRERPNTSLKSSALFEDIAAWYVSRFMPAHKIPSVCLPEDVAVHFNAVVHEHAGLGLSVTRFMLLLWSVSPASKERYDLNNGLDALLFTLEMMASELPSNPHYRPFFASMFGSSTNSTAAVLDASIVAMSDPIESSRAAGAPLSQLIALNVMEPLRPATVNDDLEVQEVLVIGHEGQGTGLSRNFGMLVRALKQENIALKTLSYEMPHGQFAGELRAWRDGCRSRPVVIVAVNAQDVPALFLRDRDAILNSCYVVGFFLWETSQAPHVQKLGIALVDEIWAPTKYVAEVYAPFAPVTVIGKGLFGDDEWPKLMRKAEDGPIRFLTVFDFHSSIERKNPSAAVQAFQAAFTDGENVELVVKVSNVNPQHPGNASGQWERVCAAAERDKRIRIVTSRYTEEQMQQLMRATSCVVSLHRAEGFGYVLADAMAHGVPVVATAYSGNTDFCDPETSFPVAYRLVPVRSHGAHWERGEAQWAEPDIDSAAGQMQRVYRDYPEALRKAAVGRRAILGKYSTEVFAARLRAGLNAIRHPVPETTDLLDDAIR